MEKYVNYCYNFWENLDKYVDRKYIIDDGGNHFVQIAKPHKKAL